MNGVRELDGDREGAQRVTSLIAVAGVPVRDATGGAVHDPRPRVVPLRPVGSSGRQKYQPVVCGP